MNEHQITNESKVIPGKVLLASATPFEIGPFMKKYRRLKLQHIETMVTGIGVMRATYSITMGVRQAGPELIIQAGIAGSFDSRIPLGSVVVVKEDTIADLGVEEQGAWRTPHDLGLEGHSLFPSTGRWFRNRATALIRHTQLPAVRGVTVNQVTTRRSSINLIRERFNPAVESMEGAACHYTGLMEKIPFLQVMAISNYIGERNKKKWKMDDAIHNLNEFLSKLLLSDRIVAVK